MLDHFLQISMEKIIEALCRFVPSRTDIHQKIRSDLSGELSWDTQRKLVEWAEKFQAPVHDRKTREWKKTFPQPDIELFLNEYGAHLEIIFREVWEAREKLNRGDNIFVSPDHVVEGTNGVPTNMRTGGRKL